MVGPEGIEPSTLGLKVSSERCRVVSVGDEKCLSARVSGVVGFGPIRLVATNIRVKVVRMWSAQQRKLISHSGSPQIGLNPIRVVHTRVPHTKSATCRYRIFGPKTPAHYQ